MAKSRSQVHEQIINTYEAQYSMPTLRHVYLHVCVFKKNFLMTRMENVSKMPQCLLLNEKLCWAGHEHQNKRQNSFFTLTAPVFLFITILTLLFVISTDRDNLPVFDCFLSQRETLRWARWRLRALWAQRSGGGRRHSRCVPAPSLEYNHVYQQPNPNWGTGQNGQKTSEMH